MPFLRCAQQKYDNTIIQEKKFFSVTGIANAKTEIYHRFNIHALTHLKRSKRMANKKIRIKGRKRNGKKVDERSAKK